MRGLIWITDAITENRTRQKLLNELCGNTTMGNEVKWIGKCARCGEVNAVGIMFGTGHRTFYCNECLSEDEDRIQELEHYREERKRNAHKGRVVELKIQTYVPCKWRFIDLETGEAWMGDHDGSLKRDFSLGVNGIEPEETAEETAKIKKKKAKKKAKRK